MAEVESKIQRRCQKVMTENEVFVFKTHGDMYTRVGIPDLIACVPVTEAAIRQLLKVGLRTIR